MIPIGITVAISLLAVKFANWLQTENEFGHTAFQKITDLVQFKGEGVDWNGNECTYSVTLTERFKDWKVDYEQWIYNTNQAWDSIKETTGTKIQELKDNISTSWSEIKEDTTTKWEETKTNLATKWEEIKTNASTSFQNVKDTISTKWEETKTKTSNKWTEIKNNLSTTWSNLKKDSSDKFTEMKENIGKSFDTLKENIKRPINGIINFVEKMANGVVDAVNKIIATVNSLGSVDIPGVGTVGIDIPTLDHVHIPRLADGGFVPNTNMGSLFWAGENGAEIVANASGGTEVLNASQVASAVASGVREAIIDAVTPYMVDLVNSNQAIADKDMSVNIGDREIAEANRRGESSLGLQLVTV